MDKPVVKNHFIPTVPAFDADSFKHKQGNIIIVAPHPDDDVIGVGGTMRLLADKGCNVFSIYITDGSSPVFKNNNIQHIRRQEALAALRIVKARGGIFLNHKSRGLTDAGAKKIIDELRDILQFFIPEQIYLPSPFENHTTHNRVTSLAIRAIRRTQNYHPELWGYHVWGGMYGLAGSKTIDISRTVFSKRKAIRMHKSQIESKAYDTAMIGRNHYEGVFLETHRQDRFEYAETFLNMQDLIIHPRLSLKSFTKSTLKKFLT